MAASLMKRRGLAERPSGRESRIHPGEVVEARREDDHGRLGPGTDEIQSYSQPLVAARTSFVICSAVMVGPEES